MKWLVVKNTALFLFAALLCLWLGLAIVVVLFSLLLAVLQNNFGSFITLFAFEPQYLTYDVLTVVSLFGPFLLIRSANRIL